MSRTHRKRLTDSNHREARRGRANRAAAWSATLPETRHGGMARSPRVTGRWGDDFVPSDHAKRPGDLRRDRRDKRRERREALRFAGV